MGKARCFCIAAGPFGERISLFPEIPEGGKMRQEGKAVSLFQDRLPEENVPEYESCVLHFQDGTEHIYKVPVMRVQGYSPEEPEERHLNILIPFLPVRFRGRIKKVSGRELTEFILRCTAVLDREEERNVLSERVRKDIGEFLWKACGYLLEGDAELYREVSAEVEPAIKLSREIIEELREDIEELRGSNRELQNDNRELQENIRELQHDMENGCQRLLAAQREEGKSKEEAKALLMTVFALSESAAKEKMKIYWKRE